MKNNLIKVLMGGLISMMVIMPCGKEVQAAEFSKVHEIVPITETKSSLTKLKNLEKLKAQIAGLLNIDISQIDKIIVKTSDTVKVTLKDSNVSININIKLADINININQK